MHKSTEQEKIIDRISLLSTLVHSIKFESEMKIYDDKLPNIYNR